MVQRPKGGTAPLLRRPHRRGAKLLARAAGVSAAAVQGAVGAGLPQLGYAPRLGPMALGWPRFSTNTLYSRGWYSGVGRTAPSAYRGGRGYERYDHEHGQRYEH